MDVNWDEIKIEYVTTNISQRKLAAKYGIPTASICRRSKAGNWVKERERYRSKVMAKTLDKTANKEAGRLSRLMEATSDAIEAAAVALEDPQQFYRHLVSRSETYTAPTDMESNADKAAPPVLLESRQWTEEQVFKKLDTKALKDITGVLKDLTGLMRDFYNIPTPSQAEAQRIAAARLELDRQKAAAADNDVKELEVVFSAGPEEWNE